MIEEKKLVDAESLWSELGRLQMDSDSDNEIIFRGHSNSRWGLIPTILRPQSIKKLTELIKRHLKSEDLVGTEFGMLRDFIYSCDEACTTIPNDSVRLRERNLRDESFRKYLPFLRS